MKSKGSLGGDAPARTAAQEGLPGQIVEAILQIVAVEAEAQALVAAETERAEALVTAARGEARELVAKAREQAQAEGEALVSSAHVAAAQERAARLEVERAAMARLVVAGPAQSRAVEVVVRCVLGLDEDEGEP